MVDVGVLFGVEVREMDSCGVKGGTSRLIFYGNVVDCLFVCRVLR